VTYPALIEIVLEMQQLNLILDTTYNVFGETLNLTQPNHGTLKKNSTLKIVAESG